MLEKVLKNNSNLITIAGGAIAPIVFLAYCFSTISYKGTVFMVLAAVVGSLAAFVYRAVWAVNWANNMQAKKACVGSNIMISVILMLMLFTVRTEFVSKYYVLVYISLAVWIGICILNFIQIKKSIYLTVGRVFSYIANHKYLFLVLLIIGVVAIEGIGYPIKWDGLLYYGAVDKATLSSLSSIALYGHVSVTAGFVYRLFFALFSMGKYGMIIANILMLMVAVIAFYGILKTVFPGKSDLEYAFSSLPFGVSPFLAGMAGYYSTDWFSVCLITVLIYFILRKQWILGSVCAVLFCLTKEPALIAYTGLCIGLVLNDLFENNEKIMRKIKTVFCSVHYYILLIPYFIWFVIYIIMGHWSAGDGGFGIDVKFLVEKLKVMLVFNFNWIWTLATLITVGILIASKRFYRCADWFIPLACSNGCLLVFNVLFKTVNHPRYIDSFISINILLAVLCVWTVSNNKKVTVILSVIMAVVGIISCYTCIDPLTYSVFESSKVGKGRLITTGGSPMGDEAIYNKQMMWVEVPLCEAISDAIEEGTEIVIPVRNDAIYAYNGMSQHICSEDKSDVLYWDPEAESRIAYADADVSKGEIVEFYYYLDSKESKKSDYNKVSVIYIKGLNDYSLDENYKIVATMDYSYRGYVITRDIVIFK